MLREPPAKGQHQLIRVLLMVEAKRLNSAVPSITLNVLKPQSSQEVSFEFRVRGRCRQVWVQGTEWHNAVSTLNPNSELETRNSKQFLSYVQNYWHTDRRRRRSGSQRSNSRGCDNGHRTIRSESDWN